jgi:cytoskeleton-associated protein 5
MASKPTEIVASPSVPAASGVRRATATTPSNLSREAKPLSLPSMPFVSNEDKAKRQRQDDNITDEGRGWTFKTPRPEHAQHLQQQAKPYLGESLHAKMFAKDFRKHREALQELTAAVNEHAEATTQNADLLLKWASLRLFDENTSTQTKTLAFLEHLFQALDTNDYHLADYEAGIILPVLLECLGQGEEMQEGVGALLKIVPRVYPSSKFFGFLLNAGLLGSKSPRTRTECLEQMAVLIRKQGLTVCPSPSVAFPHIVQFVTDKVAAVRNAALAIIQQAHLHVGDDLWLYTGSLNDTQKTLINQKMGSDSPLRSSAAAVPRQPSSIKKVMQSEDVKSSPSRSSSPSASLQKQKTPTTSAGSSKSVIGVRTTVSSALRAAAEASRPKTASDDSAVALQSFSLELDKLSVAKPKSTGPRAMPALELTSVPALLTAPTPSLPTRLLARTATMTAAESSSSPNSSPIVDSWVKELESGDIDRMVTACKAIIEKLAEGTTLFVGCSDALATTLAGLLSSTLKQKDFSIDQNREFKYFVNVLFKLFTPAVIAVSVGREAVKVALRALMLAYVDPLVVPRSGMPTGASLTVAFVHARRLLLV